VQVWPLRLIDLTDSEQFDFIYTMLGRLPHIIHHYLTVFVFPEVMKHQGMKLSASCQELGGNMLFSRRLGFSGTPSDLLPLELGHCHYEKGSEGKMLHLLSSPDICSYQFVPQGWTAESLLTTIATAQPPLHSLIDTGALITGMTNYGVAEFLLDNGLQDIDGVVYLDEEDRKMVLMREGKVVVPIAQCGVPKNRRFAFYDQVHTTGMDIQHMLNACAATTLGKDMTFRDYAQGTFRMRGIGKGQTIRLFIIPEVLKLIQSMSIGRPRPPPEQQVVQMLKDVVAWLILNSCKTEKIQFNMLCEQNMVNIWRKRAFADLMTNHLYIGTTKCAEKTAKCIDVFRERLDWGVESTVPKTQNFAAKLGDLCRLNSFLLDDPADQAAVAKIQSKASWSAEQQFVTQVGRSTPSRSKSRSRSRSKNRSRSRSRSRKWSARRRRNYRRRRSTTRSAKILFCGNSTISQSRGACRTRL
jgi:hypothetical protein